MKNLLLLYLFILSACVGTIQDNSTQQQTAYQTPPVIIDFDGIAFGTAVSHQSVRLSFKPAKGGGGIYDYRVYMNGSSTASASVASDAIVEDGQGYLHVVVTGLALGTTYTFNIQAFDKEYDYPDGNKVDVNVTTLNYKVPLFNGISSIENLAGLDGETKLQVSWAVATEAEANSNPIAVPI